MGMKVRKASETGFYHVYSRGVGKRMIFEDDADRKAFLSAVNHNLRQNDVEIYAWCLMGNHFHLLLRGDMQDVSRFVGSALGLYAKAFNERHGRVGHLFQGRFGSEPIDRDEYFLQAVRYIHQNPEKAGIAPTAGYRWSSYREYVGVPRITRTELALDMIGSVDEFARFHRLESSFALEEYDGDNKAIAMERACHAALSEFGPERVRDISSLPRGDRDRALARLQASGLPLREIERITGISRSTIARATRK